MKTRTDVVTLSARAIVTFSAFAFVLLPQTANSDVFTLKDGTVIIGQIERQSADRFDVITSFGMIELDRTKVASHERGGPWPEGTAFGPMVADTYGTSNVGIGASFYEVSGGSFNGSYVNIDFGYGITDRLDAVGFFSHANQYNTSTSRVEVGGGAKLGLRKDGPGSIGMAAKINATYAQDERRYWQTKTRRELIVLGDLIFSEAFGPVHPYIMVGGSASRNLAEDRNKLSFDLGVAGGMQLVIGRNWALYCGAGSQSAHVSTYSSSLSLETQLGLQYRFSPRNMFR